MYLNLQKTDSHYKLKHNGIKYANMQERANPLRKMECESRYYFYFKYSLAALNGKRLPRKEIASHTNCSKSIIIF